MYGHVLGLLTKEKQVWDKFSEQICLIGINILAKRYLIDCHYSLAGS